MAEMAQSQETVLERQAKMRERAKVLREKREAERVALVEKKLDQRWRCACTCMYYFTNKPHYQDVHQLWMMSHLHDAIFSSGASVRSSGLC